MPDDGFDSVFGPAPAEPAPPPPEPTLEGLMNCIEHYGRACSVDAWISAQVRLEQVRAYAALLMVQGKPSPRLARLVAFLCGEEEFDGVWYGERHPTERGSFWWRKHLREAAGSDEGMVRAMVKLTRALGTPTQVEHAEGQCLEAALVELAARKLEQDAARKLALSHAHGLREPAPGVKVCPECGGEGICYRTQALDDCTACNGTGRVPASGVPASDHQPKPGDTPTEF